MENEKICAISTPLGRGAVAIVRISGQGSLDVALKIFKSKGLTKDNVISRHMYLGKLFLDEGEELCFMVFFKAPNSFTGEDCVEFQIHGGSFLAQKVLRKVMSTGVRLAEAGEFSKRAFMNGKISLDEAESIIDEIDAESESELHAVLSVSGGRLGKKIEKMQEKVENILAEIEVNIDYPDEVDENKLRTNGKNELLKIQSELNEILKNSESSKYMKNGLNVALVGLTNVGKSSIMNALLGTERAIVTDIKGTTRDVVSETFLHKGFKINLFDTAGIRETDDLVENLGIEKSKDVLNFCDLALMIVDGSEKENLEEESLLKLIENKKKIFVVNKSDKKRLHKMFEDEIEVSAKTQKNIELLKDKIIEMMNIEEISTNSLVVSNERQIETLKNSYEILKNMLNNENHTLDIFATELKSLWSAFGKVTGKTENENIIDLIFSKFCLGK